MPRNKKRKVFINVENENGVKAKINLHNKILNNSKIINDQMYCLMSVVQMNGTFNKKHIKDMQSLYRNMNHGSFMEKFITIIKTAMEADEKNACANNTLLFCAKFATSYQTEETHPILESTFEWVLSTVSLNATVRLRLCQFVNMLLNALGQEGSLENIICDNIISYMIERLQDLSSNVRTQAILALQGLQVPDNPDDIVIKAYKFYLSHDISSHVRQTIIKSITRNHNTIPSIIERLWDIDENVRRQTYIHMSSYPVKAYKVSQRLTFLEQGLNDRCEMVRKVVTKILLPQWIESYDNDFMTFISALKLDANGEEIDRFRKITKLALQSMFKKRNMEELIKNLPLEKDGEFKNCVSISNLSVEVALYWLNLVEFFQDKDEIDDVIPELSVFCSYIQSYCETIKENSDKWEKLEQDFILLTLIEILYLFDLGDEFGREKLKNLLEILLKNYDLNERIIEILIRCTENLIENQEKRLQFFIDIINDLLDIKDSKLHNLSNDQIFIDEIIQNQQDSSIIIKYSSIKLQISTLKEQEANLIENKNYSEANKITETLNNAKDEYNELLKQLYDKIILNKSSISENSFDVLTQFQQVKMVVNEIIIKCLKISFYMIASPKVNSLSPTVIKLYENFIRRYINSNIITIRDWALKCGTSYGMLYEKISKDIFTELEVQFFKINSSLIWNTAIECVFELIDRYGFSNFQIEDSTIQKSDSQLNNTLELLELDEEIFSSEEYGGCVQIINIFSHILDSCGDLNLIKSIIKGFCRLILHDHLNNDYIFEKLLIKYFNSTTDSEINQILSVLFENIIKLSKEKYFQPCLLPIITSILTAPYDNPLHDINIEIVLKFIIDSTKPKHCTSELNIHNTIALSFMQEMQNNIENRDLLRILSKELFNLKISISDNSILKNDLKLFCEKILQHNVDSIIEKNITNFKNILDGIWEGNKQNSKNIEISNSDEENCSEDEGHESKMTINTTRITEIDETIKNQNETVVTAEIVEEQGDNEDSMVKEATKSVE